MRWPWQNRKPVHDPTRNYDIYSITLPNSWTVPVMPTFTFPDNYWAQILSIRLTLTTVAGIRGASTLLIPLLTHSDISMFASSRDLAIASSKTLQIHWAVNVDCFTQRIVALPNTLALPFHLYAFPNNILTFAHNQLLNGDIISNLIIRIKRWEFY